MAKKLEELVIREISGVDDPANLHPGWLLMKASDGDVAAEAERIRAAMESLKGALEGAAEYLADSPDEVGRAAAALVDYLGGAGTVVSSGDEACATKADLPDGTSVAFPADQSLETIRQAVQRSLNEMMGPADEMATYCWVRDVSEDGRALIDYSGECFVAGFTMSDGDAALDERATWIEVEQVWVAKAVVPFQDLPLADEGTGWDGAAARKRVKEWAGGDDWDPSRYAKAFLWYDGDADDELGSYKLPIADVIDGALRAVPGAIFAAAGGHGVSAADVPSGDVDRIKKHLAKYYDKMGRTPPWAEKRRGLLDVLRSWRRRDDVGLSREDVEIVLASELAVASGAILAVMREPGIPRTV